MRHKIKDIDPLMMSHVEVEPSRRGIWVETRCKVAASSVSILLDHDGALALIQALVSAMQEHKEIK